MRNAAAGVFQSKRRQDFFQKLAIPAGAGGHGFRRVALGAALDHHGAMETGALQFAEHGGEIHFALAEVESDILAWVCYRTAKMNGRGMVNLMSLLALLEGVTKVFVRYS